MGDLDTSGKDFWIKRLVGFFITRLPPHLHPPKGLIISREARSIVFFSAVLFRHDGEMRKCCRIPLMLSYLKLISILYLHFYFLLFLILIFLLLFISFVNWISSTLFYFKKLYTLMGIFTIIFKIFAIATKYFHKCLISIFQRQSNGGHDFLGGLL